MDFAEIGQCKLVLLGLSLAGNLVKPLLSLYGTEWRERGYGLRKVSVCVPYKRIKVQSFATHRACFFFMGSSTVSFLCNYLA